VTPKQQDYRPQRGGWAPGLYLCQCRKCSSSFIGDKRAVECAECAYKVQTEHPTMTTTPTIYTIRCSWVGWHPKPVKDTNVHEAVKIFVRRRMRQQGHHSAKLRISLTFREHRKAYGAEEAEVDALVTTKDDQTFKFSFGVMWRIEP